jgi:hypothetical protein
MVMELNCITLGKTSLSDSFTVRVLDTNNIDGDLVEFDRLKIGSLKYLICCEKNIKIDTYNDLKLWKADITLGNKLEDITEEQIKKDNEELLPIEYFTKYFPNQRVADNSLIFIQVPVITGKCLPIFYLSNKRFALSHIFLNLFLLCSAFRKNDHSNSNRKKSSRSV